MQKFYDKSKHKGEVWPGTIDEDFKIGVLLGCQEGRKIIKRKKWVHVAAIVAMGYALLAGSWTFAYTVWWQCIEEPRAWGLAVFMAFMVCWCGVHIYRNILMLKNLRGFTQVSHMWEEKFAELVEELSTEAK